MALGGREWLWEGGKEGGVYILINLAIYTCIHNVYTMFIRVYMIHCM